MCIRDSVVVDDEAALVAGDLGVRGKNLNGIAAIRADAVLDRRGPRLSLTAVHDHSAHLLDFLVSV